MAQRRIGFPIPQEFLSDFQSANLRLTHRGGTQDSTREALHHKIKNGERVGKVRFGYDLADDGRTLVPNDAEQEAIDWMKQLRAEGLTLRQIADALTDRGIVTKEGRQAWTHSAVGYILKRIAA